MTRPLDILFSEGMSIRSDAQEQQRLADNLSLLRQTLDPQQKKLLLRILDSNDAICEIAVRKSYERGFRQATQLMIDCLYKE